MNRDAEIPPTHGSQRSAVSGGVSESQIFTDYRRGRGFYESGLSEPG